MSTAIADDDQYFLTRQSANIMEDLSRLSAVPGSISVLHGDSQVGKTRLLDQFRNRYLTAGEYLAVQFTSKGDCRLNSAEGNSAGMEISEAMLLGLLPDTTLLVDQFENAPESVKHEILGFWAREGKRKSLSLVVSGSEELLSELQAYPFQANQAVNSVRLNPLTRQECRDYLGSKLCPEPGRQLQLTRPVKQLIKRSRGLIGNLDQLLAQQNIDCKCVESYSTAGRGYGKTKAIIVTMVVLVIAVLSVPGNEPGWSLLYSTGPEKAKQPEPPGFTSTELAKAQVKEMAVEPIALPPPSSRAGSKEVDRPEDPAANALMVPAPHQESPADKVISAPESRQSTDTAEIGLLQQRLEATQNWLDSRQASVATIQVMTLSSRTTPETALTRYLEQLKDEGIDLAEVFIYRVERSKTTVYGVLVGSYPARRAALQQIENLPRILKANQPIPRTVGGIRKEIGFKARVEGG